MNVPQPLFGKWGIYAATALLALCAARAATAQGLSPMQQDAITFVAGKLFPLNIINPYREGM